VGVRITLLFACKRPFITTLSLADASSVAAGLSIWFRSTFWTFMVVFAVLGFLCLFFISQIKLTGNNVLVLGLQFGCKDTTQLAVVGGLRSSLGVALVWF